MLELNQLMLKEVVGGCTCTCGGRYRHSEASWHTCQAFCSDQGVYDDVECY